MNGGREFLNRKVYYPGQKIFGEGELGERAFLVESGQVEISKNTDGGGPIVLGAIGPGGIFGEMALIDNQPRMATARAVAETSLIIISQQMFHEKLRKADPFLRGLLNIFVRNIRNLSKAKAADAAPPKPPADGAAPTS